VRAEDGEMRDSRHHFHARRTRNSDRIKQLPSMWWISRGRAGTMPAH